VSAQRSRRAWGWHRLTSSWAERIVAGAGIRPGDLVFDIGAGNGVLTARLLDAGARVVAVELHPGRVARLRTRFATAPVRVVHADAADLRLPHRPFRVVSSPPYAITGTLLAGLLAPGSSLVAADLVLQRAVARRYAEGSRPGARRWMRRWDLSLGQSVPRSAFEPSPKVDSAVLVVRRRSRTR
jgi:23S rRNA (adenine-N6)-dimethyltransferase